MYYRHFDDPDQEYLASERTFYRLARRLGLPPLSPARTVKGQHRARPEIAASMPGEVIVWDVTWVKGFYAGQKWPMYSFMDLYSRYIVGFTIQPHESGTIAADLFDQVVKANNLNLNTADITILHNDNGGPMTSERMKHTLGVHGISQSLIRPSVSNNNAHMESCHRVVKYHRFARDKRLPENIDEATDVFAQVSDVYNTCDYHSGIAYYTPNMVYNGAVNDVAQARGAKKEAHYRQHPNRYTRPPSIELPPSKVTINLAKPPRRYANEPGHETKKHSQLIDR
ncbi:DDE-type integrase/transposase/recombinase [Trueperella pecoris]|uniref:DDE-type integrase/transposase/recombinase n=1 Tax=Trueperella pecoris TaxID=2733571 RepID=UPI001ABED337|nr:DDE-type integrase/transposase/recombinase [Trueperella pecoris]QTG75777.1 transposase [Trueperella pecoris]